jgi:hypothetical protein
MLAQKISRLTVSGSALTGSNLYDAIALSIGVGGIVALTPIVLARYRAEFPSFIIQAALIVALYLYVRSAQLLERYKEWPQRLLLLVSFTIPLEQTFFPHTLAKLLWLMDPYLGLQLFRVSNILLFAVTVAALRDRGLASPLLSMPFLIKSSFAVGVAGFALATAFSDHPLISLAGGSLEFLPVYCAIFAFHAIAPDARFIGHACSLFLLACLGVAVTQIIALAPVLCCDHAFYLRATMLEFIVTTMDQNDQMRVVAINGYGNPLHYVSLALLLIPFTAGYIYSQYGSRLAIPALLIIVYSTLLLYSRSGTIIVFMALIFMFSILIWKHRIFSTTLAILITFIAFAHASKEALDYHVRGAKTLASRAAASVANTKHEAQPAAVPPASSKNEAQPAASPPASSKNETQPAESPLASSKNEAPPAASPLAGSKNEVQPAENPLANEVQPAASPKNEPQPASSLSAAEPATAAANAAPAAASTLDDQVAPGAASGAERADAWHLGLEIARKNWLAGIGYAVYRLVEPIHTAPHSLLLKRWAEGGLLSAISIVLLAAFALLRLCSLLRTREPSIFQIGCLVGVNSFFLQAMIFGADLSVMGLTVWGYGVGMLLAASQAKFDEARARARERRRDRQADISKADDGQFAIGFHSSFPPAATLAACRRTHQIATPARSTSPLAASPMPLLASLGCTR